MKQRELFSFAIGYRNKASRSSAGMCLTALLLFMTGALFLVLPMGSRAQTATPAQPQQQTTQDGRPRRADSVPSHDGRAQSNAPTLVRPVQATPNASPTPPPQTDAAGQEVGDDEPIRVETNLVNLNVRVIDRNNRPINNVQQSEFHVFENGVPQPVQFFSTEEVPISYGLAIDTSYSLKPQMQDVIDAAKTIISSNKPGDETFVETFVDNDKIEIVRDFTADKNGLEDALDELYAQTGQTAVIDGVYLAAQHVSEYKKGDDLSDRRRRALIVVTDGEDRESYYKQAQLFDRIREEGVQIYVIGFVNELDKDNGGIIKKSSRERAMTLLNRMASESGGRAFYPTSLSELPGIAQEITRDLRTQYVIGYNPTNKSRDGSYRAIRVVVGDEKGRDKRIALTRAGYYAPRGDGRQTSSPGARPNNGAPNNNGGAPTTRRRNP